GVVAADSLSLTTASGSYGNITLGDAASGTSYATVEADGSGTVSQTAGVLSGGNVNVSSGSGNINMSTDANKLTVSTGADVTINNANGMLLGTSTVGGQLNVTANGAMSVIGDVLADNLQLSTASGSNGSINLGGNVKGTTSAAVSADGSGNITQSQGTLTGSTMTLASQSGDIGIAKGKADTLTLNTTGNASFANGQD